MGSQQLIKTFGPSDVSMSDDIDEWIEKEEPVIEAIIMAGGDVYRTSFITRILYRKRTQQQKG